MNKEDKHLSGAGLSTLWDKIKANFVSALGTSGNNLTWTKNGTTTPITVPFATTASKLSNTSAIGGSTQPVYFKATGEPDVCSTYAGGTKVTLNNTDLGGQNATIYAPTAGGTNNYVLIGKGATSEPQWTAQSNLSVGVAAKLGTATKGSSSLPIYLNAGVPTAVSSVGEGYLSWGGKNLTKYPSPLDISLLQEGHNNYAAFAPADHVTIEYSQDGGATWADYGASDANKTYLFTRYSTYFVIGNNTSSTVDFTNYQLRVTLNTEGLMGTYINKFLIQARKQGSSGSWCTIETRTQENKENNVDTWDTNASQVVLDDYWNTINLSGPFQTYFSGSTKTTKGQIRFTFGVTGYTSGKTGLRIYNIYCYGRLPLNAGRSHSNMAWTGHLYGFDNLQNATFPADVSATTFNSYTLAAACAKGVDTSIGSSPTNNNVPTSLAVSTLVSGYLPLTGGTIASATFGAFAVQRNHTTNPAGIAFKHYSSGTTVETMGYLAMAAKDGPFKRYNGAASTSYIMWDASNSNLATVDWTCRDIIVNRNIELPACTASENYLFRIGSKNILQVNSQGNTVFNFGYSDTSGNNLLLYANASHKAYVGGTQIVNIDNTGLSCAGGVAAQGITDLSDISGGGGQSGYADEAGMLSSLTYQTYAHSNASSEGTTTFTNVDTYYKDTANDFNGTQYTFILPEPSDTKRHVVVIHFVHVSGQIYVRTTNDKVAYHHDFMNWNMGNTFDDANHWIKCEWMYDMWLVADYN